MRLIVHLIPSATVKNAVLKPAGDWFNRLDWTGQHNNFGVGLPPTAKNRDDWPEKRPFLGRQVSQAPHQDPAVCTLQSQAVWQSPGTGMHLTGGIRL